MILIPEASAGIFHAAKNISQIAEVGARVYKAGSKIAQGFEKIKSGFQLTTDMRNAFRADARTIMGKTNQAYNTAKVAAKQVQVHHNIPL